MIDVELAQCLGDFRLDVSFRAEAPIVGLFGRSGSGKTSVVNALAGISQPQRGRVVVNGVLPPLFSRDERLALESAAPFQVNTRGDAALAAGRDRAIRERVQAQSLERLSRELAVSPLFLPLLMQDAANPESIRALARRI